MSVQSDIYDFMAALRPEDDSTFVPMTAAQIAIQTGQARDKVNKTLHNLMTRGKIELQRGTNGRDIVGFRMLEPNDKRRRGRPPGVTTEPRPERAIRALPAAVLDAPQRRSRMIATPRIDEYASKKARYDQLTRELGDYFEGSFRTDPLAEEAMFLRDRLAVVEEQLIEARRNLRDVTDERDALRTKHIQATTRKAVEAGAMVQHSAD
jgi:hypothetical protein